MLKLALAFAVIALVLAILGFGGLAGAMIDIAIVLFWIALIVAAILFLVGFLAARKASGR